MNNTPYDMTYSLTEADKEYERRWQLYRKITRWGAYVVALLVAVGVQLIASYTTYLPMTIGLGAVLVFIVLHHIVTRYREEGTP